MYKHWSLSFSHFPRPTKAPRLFYILRAAHMQAAWRCLCHQRRLVYMLQFLRWYPPRTQQEEGATSAMFSNHKYSCGPHLCTPIWLNPSERVTHLLLCIEIAISYPPALIIFILSIINQCRTLRKTGNTPPPPDAHRAVRFYLFSIYLFDTSADPSPWHSSDWWVVGWPLLILPLCPCHSADFHLSVVASPSAAPTLSSLGWCLWLGKKVSDNRALTEARLITRHDASPHILSSFSLCVNTQTAADWSVL